MAHFRPARWQIRSFHARKLLSIPPGLLPKSMNATNAIPVTNSTVTEATSRPSSLMKAAARSGSGSWTFSRTRKRFADTHFTHAAIQHERQGRGHRGRLHDHGLAN